MDEPTYEWYRLGVNWTPDGEAEGFHPGDLLFIDPAEWGITDGRFVPAPEAGSVHGYPELAGAGAPQRESAA